MLASFVIGCQSSRYSQVTFHRPLPDVVAAIQKSCAPIEAQRQQPGARWITGTTTEPNVSYTVFIQDHFTSYPVGRTEISAVSRSSTETQLRVISLEPKTAGWWRRHHIESQTIAEISQILEE